MTCLLNFEQTSSMLILRGSDLLEGEFFVFVKQKKRIGSSFSFVELDVKS